MSSQTLNLFASYSKINDEATTTTTGEEAPAGRDTEGHRFLRKND